MKTMITGIRPTGCITLANYIGGMKNFIDNQYKYNSIIFIADIHGLTTYIDASIIRKNILDITALYLASGIDINNTIIFKQSDVLEHCNLGYLMAFQCGVGELSRMTQYKSKKNELKKSDKDMGLFIYPTLMAADILLYDASVVPVGKDQVQHIEITREIGNRFNKVYGNTFVLPEYETPKVGSKIMNLQNASTKMSKSANINDRGTIFILDDIEITRKKILSAITDSDNKIYFDEEKKTGISNLLSIVASITNKSIKEMENIYKDYNYKDFKEDVANVVCNFISDIQSKYYKFRNDESYLEKVLNVGGTKARIIANKKLNIVKKKVGLI